MPFPCSLPLGTWLLVLCCAGHLSGIVTSHSSPSVTRGASVTRRGAGDAEDTVAPHATVPQSSISNARAAVTGGSLPGTEGEVEGGTEDWTQEHTETGAEAKAGGSQEAVATAAGEAQTEKSGRLEVRAEEREEGEEKGGESGEEEVRAEEGLEGNTGVEGKEAAEAESEGEVLEQPPSLGLPGGGTPRRTTSVPGRDKGEASEGGPAVLPPPPPLPLPPLLPPPSQVKHKHVSGPHRLPPPLPPPSAPSVLPLLPPPLPTTFVPHMPPPALPASTRNSSPPPPHRRPWSPSPSPSPLQSFSHHIPSHSIPPLPPTPPSPPHSPRTPAPAPAPMEQAPGTPQTVTGPSSSPLLSPVSAIPLASPPLAFEETPDSDAGALHLLATEVKAAQEGGKGGAGGLLDGASRKPQGVKAEVSPPKLGLESPPGGMSDLPSAPRLPRPRAARVSPPRLEPPQVLWPQKAAPEEKAPKWESRAKCPSLDSPLLRNQLSREAIGYNITAPLHWRPVKNRYLLMHCSAGRASNRMICIQNHVFLAFLLNRSLLLAPGLRDPSRHRYNWSLILSTPRLQACYGRAVVVTPPLVHLPGTRGDPILGATPQGSPGQPRGNAGGSPGVDQEKGRRGRRLGEGGSGRAGPLKVGAVLCWRNRMVGERSLCFVPWKLLRGAFIPPLTSRNVEGMDLEALLRLHREELQGVPAIMVLDLFYAGELLYRAKDPAFVDLPIVTTKACAGGPVLLPHSDIVTAAAGFVRGAPGVGTQSDTVTGAVGAGGGGLGNQPFLALHLRRKDFLTTCARGWASACISLREVAGCIAAEARRHNLSILVLCTDAVRVEVRRIVAMLQRQRVFKGGLYVNPLPPENAIEGLTQGQEGAAAYQKMVMVHSSVFIGTNHSTFSLDVVRMRKGYLESSCHDSYICERNEQLSRQHAKVL